MTVAQALATAAAMGLTRLDAQLLLLHALGGPGNGRGWLLAHDRDELDPAAHRQFMQLCDRRAGGEPLAYIVGRREFFGLELMVDERVLVPRPDTESLVEWALELLRPCSAPRVVDLGTGSGAIALAIKANRPDAQVLAIDASAAALEVATANANALALVVEFRRHDWLAGLVGRYNLIVSNPPYIAVGDPHLPALAHEPSRALVSGPDGLDDIRRIIDQAPAALAPGGWLILEHGYDQAASVRELLQQAGFRQVASRLDLAGTQRCSGGQWLELG
jgi:release factor glutamine methyltransferase